MNYFQYNCKYDEWIPIKSNEIVWTTNSFISYYEKTDDNKFIQMAIPDKEPTKQQRIKTVEDIIEEYEGRLADYLDEMYQIKEKLIYYKELLQKLNQSE